MDCVLITVTEAARLLSVSRPTIYNGVVSPVFRRSRLADALASSPET